MDIDKLFEGMAKADVNGRGNYMKEGIYTVEMKNIFVKKGTNPKKPGDSFIVEFTILESNNAAHVVGTSGSWVLKFSWPATFGHITKFVMALLGEDPGIKANIDNPELRETVARYTRAVCGSDLAKKELGADWEDGIFNGAQLKVECSAQTTSSGGPFTAFAWSPIAETAAA